MISFFFLSSGEPPYMQRTPPIKLLFINLRVYYVYRLKFV